MSTRQDAYERDVSFQIDRPRASALQKQATEKHLRDGKLTDEQIMRITDISPVDLGRIKLKIKAEEGQDMGRYPTGKIHEVRERLRAGEDPGMISQTTGVKLATVMAMAAAVAKVSGIVAPPAAPVVDETPEIVNDAAAATTETPEPTDNETGTVNDSPTGEVPVDAPKPVRRCRVCGCTDDHACLGGCWWVEADLCSACLAKMAVDAPLFYSGTVREITEGDRVAIHLPIPDDPTMCDDDDFDPLVCHSGPVVRIENGIVWVNDGGKEIGVHAEHLTFLGHDGDETDQADELPVVSTPTDNIVWPCYRGTTQPILVGDMVSMKVRDGLDLVGPVLSITLSGHVWFESDGKRCAMWHALQYEGRSEDLNTECTEGSPVEAPSADTRRRINPFWNAHVCQEMPRDLRVVRENLLDMFIVTDDKRFIGPIRLCPWCGGRPEVNDAG